MKNNALAYALKVWVTTVLIAPLLFMLKPNFPKPHHLTEHLSVLAGMAFIYMVIVMLNALYSIAACLLLYLSLNAVLKFVDYKLQRRIMMLLMGEVLTLLTFVVFRKQFNYGFNRADIIQVKVCDCLVIGLSLWFYQLHPCELTFKPGTGESFLYDNE